MGFKYTGTQDTGETNQTITMAGKDRKQNQHQTENNTSFKIKQGAQTKTDPYVSLKKLNIIGDIIYPV